MLKYFFLLLLLTGTSYSQIYSPEDVVIQFNNAVQNNDWNKVAELTMPDRMEAFKKSLTPRNYDILAEELKIKNVDSLKNLPPMEIYSLCLANLYLNAPSLKPDGGIILGTVIEKDTAYVICRSKYIIREDLIKYNNSWKIPLDGKLETLFMMEERYNLNPVDMDSSWNNFIKMSSKHNSVESYQPDDSFNNNDFKSMLKDAMEVMSDDEFISKLAIFTKKYYDKLIETGFSKDDALRIVASDKFLK